MLFKGVKGYRSLKYTKVAIKDVEDFIRMLDNLDIDLYIYSISNLYNILLPIG